jgi:RimJ/RimL family protein N-acetyltransferase
MMTMPALTTERLRLLALTAGQLRLYLVDPRQLEAALDLRPGLTPAEPALRRAISLKLSAMSEVDERLWPWFTYWLVVIAAGQNAAGLAGFKGAPDDVGQVEIGYGIEPTCRRQGYATEAVGALMDWALAFPSCQAVIAHTLETNEASMAVLQNVGFRQIGADNDELLWRIDKKTHEFPQD